MSGIKISIEQDARRLLNRLNKMQRVAVKPALNSTINQLIRKIKTATKRDVAAKLGVRQKVFGKKFQSHNKGIRKLQGKVWIGLAAVDAKKAGFSLAKAAKFAEGPNKPFEARLGRNPNYYERVGRDRFPVRKVRIYFAQIAIDSLDSWGPQIVESDYDRIIHRELRWRLAKNDLLTDSARELLGESDTN